MSNHLKGLQNLAMSGGSRAIRLAARAALWAVAITLAAIIVWIVWAVVMGGGGLKPGEFSYGGRIGLTP